MIDFITLAQQCAPTVNPQTMAAVVRVESSFNPYAIGVVGGRLERQPKNKDEAIATVKALEAHDWNFSVGVAQVNRYNLPKYNLTYEQAFEPCANLRAGSKILESCYSRALTRTAGDSQRALQAAISCYYSGNFTRGFKPDKIGQPSYVQKVLAQSNSDAMPIQVVPNIANGVSRPQRDKAASDGLPADNSPVLLDRGTAPAQLKATGEPATNDESKAVPAGNGEQANSTIVF